MMSSSSIKNLLSFLNRENLLSFLNREILLYILRITIKNSKPDYETIENELYDAPYISSWSYETAKETVDSIIKEMKLL